MITFSKIKVRTDRNQRRTFVWELLALVWAVSCLGADLPNSKDPAGIKRYTGSEIIAYRGPQFNEFLIPLGPPVTFGPVSYEKSLKTEGLVSRYTYLAPSGRSAAEVISKLQERVSALKSNPAF